MPRTLQSCVASITNLVWLCLNSGCCSIYQPSVAVLAVARTPTLPILLEKMVVHLLSPVTCDQHTGRTVVHSPNTTHTSESLQSSTGPSRTPCLPLSTPSKLDRITLHGTHSQCQNMTTRKRSETTGTLLPEGGLPGYTPLHFTFVYTWQIPLPLPL